MNPPKEAVVFCKPLCSDHLLKDIFISCLDSLSQSDPADPEEKKENETPHTSPSSTPPHPHKLPSHGEKASASFSFTDLSGSVTLS